MAPELRLVKGELDGGGASIQFAPDRMIPTRFAQASALLAVLCGLVAAFAVSTPKLEVAFWAICAIHSCIFLWASSIALRRAGVRYTLSPQRLEIERGLVARRRESIDLFRIRDVVLDQTFLQRLRGVGNVTLYSTDQLEPTLVIASIGRAQPLYEQLRDSASRARQQRVVQVDR
jgi:membrane protein YdbS with pleckstrin-like domain